MNITNLGNIPSIANQVTTGAPQAGFRHDPSATETSSGSTTQNSALLLVDLSDRQGYREDYSIRDAAESLWKQENVNFNLFDPASINRLQERIRSGHYQMTPTENELNAYIDKLRQNGLDGTVDWGGLTRELDAFKTTTPEELEDGLEYLASRYVSVMDKLERNYSGEALSAQRAKLEEIYQAGKSGMIEGYTTFLQDNLGLSTSDAQAVRDSFSAILEEKTRSYRTALDQVSEAVAKTGPDRVWLKNHDAYIASLLRTAGTAEQSKALYSVKDLAAAGQIAQSYQKEIHNAAFGNRNEATLALNLSMADMKAETMIQKGLVSKNMASLLRSSRSQGHQNAIDAWDQRLAEQERTRAPGEPKGTFAPANRSVFQGIYQAVMQAFANNGGNGAEAICAGVAYGKAATAQIHAVNPKIFRFGNPMEYYWKDFYTTPKPETTSLLKQQINTLLVQSGQASQQKNSTYQNYVSQWQDFINSIGGGVNIWA